MLANRLSRRSFLSAGVVGTLGLALSSAGRLFAAPPGRAKACILVWLNGGPTHLDTFDPKPDAAENVRGEFKAIATRLPGVRFGEHLPMLADRADRLAVVRSLTSPEADHDRAAHLLQTGAVREETVDYPVFGSVAVKEWTPGATDLPAFVTFGSGMRSPGYLGSDFAPYPLADPEVPPGLVALPADVTEERLDRRAKALEAMNRRFGKRADADAVAAQERFVQKALKLRKSPDLKAFEVADEKPATLAAYRANDAENDAAGYAFGKACLLARRLVEAGTKFVEVTLDGWDTHADNFTAVAELCKVLDPVLSALLDDLKERGLLDSTLVVCMGEFGRTPVVNTGGGRDHHSTAFSAVLAGAGVKTGQAYGTSDETGDQPKDDAVAVPDFYATLLAACGIDPLKVYQTPTGRPIKLAGKGKPVAGLLA